MVFPFLVCFAMAYGPQCFIICFLLNTKAINAFSFFNVTPPSSADTIHFTLNKSV